MEQYSAALDARDKREKAHKPFIDACKRDTYPPRRIAMVKLRLTTCSDTKLADRTASLDRSGSPLPLSTPAEASPSRPGTPGKGRQTSEAATPDLLARLRSDLSSTQRSRSELQNQLTRLQAELATSTTQASAHTQQISTLQREKRDLERRLRDRDEEVKGKTRLVEGVQDEMVGLNLQLNMAEQKSEKLKKENEELVRRWMQRKGEEAERMNSEGGWK